MAFTWFSICSTWFLDIRMSSFFKQSNLSDYSPHIISCYTLLFIIRVENFFHIFTFIPQKMFTVSSFQLQAFIVFTYKNLPKDFHGCKKQLWKTWKFFTANQKQYTVCHYHDKLVIVLIIDTVPAVYNIMRYAAVWWRMDYRKLCYMSLSWQACHSSNDRHSLCTI